MRPIHKLNGGNGATLCNSCYATISIGWTDDVLCSKCKGYVTKKNKDDLHKR
jgi:hypothetical protein